MSQETFQIRAARVDDLPSIVSIQETIVQNKVSRSWVSHLEEQLTSKNSRCLAAVANDEVVGFIISEIKVGAFGADLSGWLGYVGISPKKMGQGIGRTLARTLFEGFRKEGVNSIYTAARWDSVDMLSFFKSLGFDRSPFINLCKQLD